MDQVFKWQLNLRQDPLSPHLSERYTLIPPSENHTGNQSLLGKTQMNNNIQGHVHLNHGGKIRATLNLGLNHQGDLIGKLIVPLILQNRNNIRPRNLHYNYDN